MVICFQGCVVPSTLRRPVLAHPPPRVRVRTYFTETENSPGELSLSRIRKAPWWFRFIRISSASCREIRPEYHLQRGQGESGGPATLPSARHRSPPGPPSSPGHRRCPCSQLTDWQPEAQGGRGHVPKVTHCGRQELRLVPAFWLPSTGPCHHTRQTHGASQLALVVKNPPANAGDVRVLGSILGLGRSPGGGHGNPLQYSCLENPVDRA